MADLTPIPRHIAIVMDGNGRWASKRKLPRIAGHKYGVDALRGTLEHCLNRGVRVLTVFAFSSENWNRPPDEVSGLMDLLPLALSREMPNLEKEGIQIHFVGDLTRLHPRSQAALAQAEELTRHNTRLIFNVCFNYGGRWDITQAAARLMAQGRSIDEGSLSSAMALAHVPDPDLVIRTGGEQRISNFLLWQSAYSEFYVSDKLWPDFAGEDLDAAMKDFSQRERRFGQAAATPGVESSAGLA